MGGLCLANGLSSLQGVLPLRSRVGAIRETGARFVRDLQRNNVPLLYLFGCAQWLQEKLKQVKKLGRLSISHSREGSQRTSIQSGGGGHPLDDERARP